MKTPHQPVKESQPVQQHTISQQLLISLISILECGRSLKPEGVSVVSFKIKQALRTKGSQAIPFWQQEPFHTWQPSTGLKANVLFR